LLLRHRARSVVIVCPPSLSLKWQDEMLEKFGLDFTIVNSDLMAQMRRTHGLAANPLFGVILVVHVRQPAGCRGLVVLSDEQSDEEKGRLEQPEFASLQRSKGTRPLVAAAPGEISRLIAWGEGYQHLSRFS